MSINIFFQFATLIIFISLRFYLLLKSKKRAIDGYYWSLYRKEALNQNIVPPILEQFILDIRQWYPPLFGYMLSKLSDYFINNSKVFILKLNLLRIGIILSLPYFLGITIDVQLLIFLLIIFFSAPILAYYDNQINSRILGAILLDLLVIQWIIFFHHGTIYLLPLIILFNIVLLFLHKMSLQLYVVILLSISIYTNSLWPAISLVISFLISFFFLGYKKYFLAHIEIVKFWGRNKYNLGSHQFYESPIYGIPGFLYKNRLHGGGIKTFKRKLALVFGMFPLIFFWLAVFEINVVSAIILASILLILVSSFIPTFYCIGAGSLYNYNLVSLVCFYFVISPPSFSLENLLIYVFLVLMSVIAISKLLLKNNEYNDNELDQAIDFINTSDLNRLLVIPFQLPDEIAFKTNKRVFWGAHGLGFLWLEKYFPLMNDRIECAIKEWNLGAVVLEKSYWPEFFDQVSQDIFKKVFENDSYCILAVKNWKDKDIKPGWAMKIYPKIQSQ